VRKVLAKWAEHFSRGMISLGGHLSSIDAVSARGSMRETRRHVIPALVAVVAVLGFAAMSLHGHADGHHRDCLLCHSAMQLAIVPVLAWCIALFWFILSIFSTSIIRHDRIWHSALPATRAPPF
jgi:uncharacterized membrane protein